MTEGPAMNASDGFKEPKMARAIVHNLVVRWKNAKRHHAQARANNYPAPTIDAADGAEIEAWNSLQVARKILYHDDI